ncbi:MAG: aldehyde ferredoxin oxidoreductase family protein [Anaerolineales bacterium]|jgi:aldehyde:ferredoxin oxidoreductase
MLGGYANKIGFVDLTAGKVEYDDAPEEWKLKYLGARGLGVKYVYENGPEVDPLSPDNILCFMNGPLTGSEFNMTGRMAIVTKSPLTGTVTDSHHGGWSAARLRWAGFDGLIFKGKSEKPVYAYVTQDKVELLDASEVWGMGVHDTVKFFQDKYGKDRKELSVIAIGPAGENQVKFACWINENDRASGRGGTGCVGGSKNLKAVVIDARKNIVKASDRDVCIPVREKALKEIMDERVVTSPRKGGLSVYGTNVLMNMTNVIGGLPTKNSQFTAYEDAEKISGEYVNDNLLVDNPTCHACPVACKKEVEVKDGPYKGLHMESVEYEPSWSVGANCGNNDARLVAKMIDLANDYGFDAIEIGHPLSVWMEASEKGYTNGEGKLEWGDPDGMTEAARMVAFRDGLGNVMAEGADATAKHFGHPELAMTCKGQGVPAYDPRGIKGMGLGYATSNRGACHLRGYTPAAEVVGNVLGPSEVADPLEWKGKGEMVIIFQNVHTMTDCLDVCKFATFAESLDSFAQQYEVMTGVSSSPEHLLKVGERVYNLERHYNNLAGFGEGSDTLPDRFTKEPSTMGGSKGQVCELDDMLVEYYEKRGWENGVVPESKLKELEII